MTDVARANLSWLVPIATILATSLGSLAGVQASLIAVPGSHVGPPSPAPLDARFLALFFGAPLAALVSASVSYGGLFTRRPAIFATVGVATGLAVAIVVGFETAAIANWWASGRPADTNQAAAFLTAMLGFPTTLAGALCVEAVRFGSSSTRRSHFLGLLGVAVLIGFFAGVYVGSVAAALTLELSCPTRACEFNIPFVIGEGGLIGSWVGSSLGVVSAIITWSARSRPGA